MAKRKARQPTILPIELDGPPDILREIRQELRPTPGLPGFLGVVTYRQPLVSQVAWKDPTDMSARARSHGAREIQGWRRVWTIALLHRTSPREITAAHVKAAEKLLADYEFGVVGASNGRTYDRVDGASSGGMSGYQLDALGRYRAAMEVCGVEGARVLGWVVVDNRSISWLGKKLGLHRDRAHGRLYSSLERLREHYWPPKPAKVLEFVHEPVAALVDLDSGVLAEERMGRWRGRAA